jgi:hypothetical protein
MDPKWLSEKERKKFRPILKMIYDGNVSPSALLRDLEPYESNFKCLKSLKYHVINPDRKQKKQPSQSFKAIPRHVPLPNDRVNLETERLTRKL